MNEDAALRRVVGRQAVAELYRPYGAPTGAAYSNRHISVLSIVDRKVAHWRDYLDPLAVFDPVGWPRRGRRQRLT